MSLRIRNDHARFKDIVRGKIKQNLKQYVKKGELIGHQGKDKISIPVPRIDLPRFRFGDQNQGGVGQGEGEPGDPVPGQPQDGDGKGKPGEAGQDEGEHAMEVEVTLDELADMLGEELELPLIEPKGNKLVTDKIRYSGVTSVGPESLKHFKRTFKQALKRQVSTGTYDPKNPLIIPIREDKRYRSWRIDEKPQANAVIVYMMDVSGSMGEEQKEIVRIESFWLDTWLKRNYDGLESRYIIHDAVAKEVDKDTFFHTRESGGTMISSAYKLCADIIDADYPAEDWNIYPFHFSDGDNWSIDDTRLCISLLNDRLLPISNQFSYGQVESPYGSGQFIKDLKEHLGEHPSVVTSEIKGKDEIYKSIKDFLGHGN
ncbi:MAG: DUF444 family protein [Deltaproteobacteria bacterium]|nr:DUF444 family protein [Deltaproteobacteria bacterium]